MKGRRRTTIFRPGLMSNLIIYYKLINYKCMDNIMKCTPLGEQKCTLQIYTPHFYVI